MIAEVVHCHDTADWNMALPDTISDKLGGAHPDEARDVDAGAEQLQVLHQLLRLVLGIQDAQLCSHTT